MYVNKVVFATLTLELELSCDDNIKELPYTEKD